MAQAAYVGKANLYLFDTTTNQYTDYGSQGVTIMGSPEGIYKLGCYNDKGEYTATAPITANNEASARVALQGQGYVNFKDELNRHWSIAFESEDAAIEFGAHVAVAMYGAAYQPEANVMVCDVATGKKERLLFVNDKVKVRYTSWVVQRGVPAKEICKLGSKLETNENDERPYAFTVPANHVSVTSDMKGFEGMVVGVGEEGRRYIVIPQAAKRGSGPNAHMCFYVNVLRKRDETADAKNNMQNNGGNNNNGAFNGGYNNNVGYGGGNGAGYGNNNAGYNNGMQQNQWGGNNNQPLAIGGGPSVNMNSYTGAVALVDDPRQQQQQHQVAVAPAPAPVAPPVIIEAPPPPPPGFNAEQLQIVDRMRDQIQALTLQLREATQKLDMFRHEFNQNDAKTKPQSLAAAQLEHSIAKMLQDTDAMKDELSQRDTMLRQVEDRNKELQQKVDRFSATANQLADEKKSAINAGSEEKLDLDRRIAQLQMNVTRINGERDDVMRHLSTVKRLLEVSDQDMKTEKNKLQLAVVHFQTNETKLVTIEENLAEERARKKVLESKVISLGEEMRSVAEELRIKEGQIEERRRKIEADKLHYTQVMEEERSQAAQELRDLRQELIDEIAIRDRRYGEEKIRVAQESTERGRVQGVEDGTNEGLLEADAKIQEYVLSVQRCKSEVEGMKIRLRQIREQSEADQRRINAQSVTLAHTLDELVAQNSATELELESLKATKTTVEEQTYDLLCRTLRSLTRPVSKRDLLTIIHELRIKKPVDFSFELDREEDERKRLDEERREVSHWVRSSVLSGDYAPKMPYIRTKAPDDRPVFPTYEAAPQAQPQPVSTAPTATPLPPQEEPVADVEATRAQPQSFVDPNAGLSTEEVPRVLTDDADEHSNQGAEDMDAVHPDQSAPASDAEEDMPWGQPEPSAPEPQHASDEEEEPRSDPDITADGAIPIRAPSAPTSESEEDEKEAPTRSAPVGPSENVDKPIAIGNPDRALPSVDTDDDDDEVPPPPPMPAPAPAPAPVPIPPTAKPLPAFSDDEDDAPKPAPKKAPFAAPKKSAALFGDSDSDADGPIAPASKRAPAAAPKKAAPKRAALFDDDSD